MKKSPLCAALLSTLLLATHPAQARMWLQVYADDALVVSVDRDSVERKGDLVLAWFQYHWFRNHTEKAFADDTEVTFKRLHAMQEFDCARATVLDLERRAYDDRGYTVGSGVPPSIADKPRPVPPGPMRQVLKEACANAL